MKNIYSKLFTCFIVFNCACVIHISAQSFTFTNAGATGHLGPTQAQINTAYTVTNLAGQVTSVNGIQHWVVPVSGLYRISARGAQGGGTSGGLGALIEGDFQLTQNEVIRILVGQQGPTKLNEPNAVGGGGGTFVVRSPGTTISNILVIAGGGGGCANSQYTTRHARADTIGNNGVIDAGVANPDGLGGTSGQGGNKSVSGCSLDRGAGGGGFLTNGGSICQTAGRADGGFAFINGGNGGTNNDVGTTGAFGGGGAVWSTGFRGSGGGGGYSGGGGGQINTVSPNHSGGGGGSKNNGTNQNNVAGFNTGNGLVVITPLGFTLDSVTHTNVLCFGENTGSATVHLSGAFLNVNYAWSNGDTTATATGLSAGIHTVTVSDQFAIDSATVIISTINSAISIDSIIITNQSSCSNNDGAIQAFASGGTSPFTYSLNGNTNFVSNNGNFTSLVSGNYYFIVKDSLGCEVTSPGVYNITIPTGPSQPGLSGDTVMCLNTISTLTASLNTTHGPNATITWYNNALLQSTDSVGTGFNFLPSALVGTHTYYAVVSDAGCISPPAIHAVNINPIPFTPIVSSAATYCLNDAAIALTTNSTGIVNWYSDSTLNFVIGSGNTYIPATNTAGGFKYFATQTDSITTCESAAGNVSIWVDTLPTVNLPTLATVCEDAILQPLLGGTPTGGTYSGIGVNSFLGVFDPGIGTGIHTIFYSYTDGNGCIGKDSATITVALLPTVSFSALQNVCEKEGLIPLTGGMPAGGTYTGALVENNNFNSFNATAGSYTIIYTYTDSNNCSNSTNQTITVDPSPTVSLPWLGDICQEVPTKTISGGVPTNGTYSGQGVSGTSFTPANGVIGNNAIVYSFTDTNGCTGKDTNFIFVKPTPTVSLGNDTSICGRKQIVIDPGIVFATYNWNTGATTKSILFDSVGTTPFSKTYTITVTDANGCMASASKTVNWSECVGINENMHGVSVNYFPNPTQGTIYLDAKGLQGEDAYISITNLQGQVVYNERLGVLTQSMQKEINLNREAKGVYFVRLFSDNYNLVHRIVIN
jgi:hypothetical protein